MKSGKSYKLGDVTSSDFGNHRISARSVSWNRTGQYLSIASSDRMTRICTLEGTGLREVLSITGHGGPVERVRFHPHQDTLVCTAALDSSVRLWDVRSATQKGMGYIDIQSGTCATDIAWSGATGSSILAITERNGFVHLYDTRKLPMSSTAAKTKSSKSKAFLKSFDLNPSVVEACIFSPGSRHLVAATTTSGMGEMTILNTKEKSEKFLYPAHTGPIYSLAFSTDGRRLATGGSDATVGLWDVENMVCTSTISRCTKFTRSVAFSHDSNLVCSSDEDGVDVASAETGDLVGKINFNRRGGSDEISFHPKGYVLACARCPGSTGGPPSAVTVAKLTINTN